VSTLPGVARAAAEDSIGRANAVAASLPASEAARIRDAAADAFTSALGIGFTVAAACALLAAELWLPAAHRASAAVAERHTVAVATAA
jgi:hypothetical protein